MQNIITIEQNKNITNQHLQKNIKKKYKKEERDCGTAIHVQLFVLSRIINENHHLLLSLIKYCHVNYAKHTTRMHYQCLIKVSKHVLLLLHNV